ncbi:MAG: type IV pilus twitching motility protein PilT [Cyanobacteriota bacterium]|nr:type IV pilus twitching motility protein PilT [Cyanobacteriota bacterium]
MATPLAPPPPPPPQPRGSAPIVAQPVQSHAIPAQLPTSIEEIVRVAFERNFSDVHLGVGEEPRYRARGEIVRTGWPATDLATFRDWLRQMLSPSEVDLFHREQEFDGSFGFPFVRVRINLFETLKGSALVMRLIPSAIPTMEALGLPPQLATIAERPKGLFLVTGPTGSGKTTTLAAIINYINTSQKRHILTIEDPIEFVHESRLSLVRQREVGQHTKLFHNALRASLREDPDIILIGEIRDVETLATALEASQTGHLVFGTLHTNSAVRTVERVLGMFPPVQQENVRRSISESLLAVLSQGLIKTTDGKRAAFFDLFINTDACRDYILRGELDEIEQIMARSAFDGMTTINQSLLRLVEEGRATADEVMHHSLKPNELAQSLRGRY